MPLETEYLHQNYWFGAESGIAKTRLDSHHKRVVLIVVNFSSISCSQTADKSNDEFPSIEGFKKPS